MAFQAHLPVRFGDIDHAGIVYYPRFFHYFHMAMEELFSRDLEVEYHLVLDERRIGLPAVHLEVDFSRPLRFGDRIDVGVAVQEIGRTSVTWHYTVTTADGETAARATIVTVCLDMDTFAKTEIPPWLRQGLERHRTATATP